MNPDSFKLQLQAVLTNNYKDIKGVQGASCCHKTRIVKRQFKYQDDNTGNEGTGAADAAAGAGAAVLPGSMLMLWPATSWQERGALLVLHLTYVTNLQVQQ